MTNWILAFDAGCSRCHDLVGRVQAVAGSDLEVGALTNAEIRDLRAKAYGDDAPWAPTLLAIDEHGVRAWTGAGLSLRVARLLGPRRSLQVMHSIGRATEVVNHDRRGLLRSVPVAGAVVFLMTGGAGTALAEMKAEKKIPLSEAARRTLGIDPAALKLVPNATSATTVTARSASSRDVRGLAGRLEQAGVQVGAATAYTAQLPIRNSTRTDGPKLAVISHSLRSGDREVGRILQVANPVGSRSIALLEREDGTTEYFAQDTEGLRGHAVISSDGRIVANDGPAEIMVPAGISCSEIVGLLCASYWGAGIPGCIAGCLASGPADPICAVACALIVGGACLLGTKWICCSCCGDC